MCIIIDVNTFTAVFNRLNSAHNNFKPVHDWIIYGKGKIVYGGAKYKAELKIFRKYMRFLKILKDVGKIVEVSDEDVNRHQLEIDLTLTNTRFNDSHLIAIIIASGCKLICSNNSRHFPYIRRREFYPNHIEPPRIYSSSRNRDLLNDTNIAEICKPCPKSTKSMVAMLTCSL